MMIPSKNLTERTFSGFFWMLLGSGAQVVLKIGVLAVLARLVEPHEFGIMGVALMVVDFSKLFTHMGVGPAIVQRENLEDRHLTTGFTLSLLMGIFFGSILLLVAPLFASFFRMAELTNVLRVISLVFLIDSITLIAQALMQRSMKFKITATFEVISYAVGYGAVGIICAYLGWGVWALVTASLAQAILNTILLVAAQPFPKKLKIELLAFKELVFFGGGFTIAKIGNYLATQGDNLVIGRTLGASALGIYGRAYQFMVMPASLFGNALDKTLFPAMAKVQGDKDRLAKAYIAGVSIIALLAIPLSIVFFFLAKEIVLVLLGNDWVEVIIPLQILSCSLLFRMSYKMSDSLTRATGAVYRRAWRQFIYAGLVIGGSYIGHFWGLYGIAIGVALALVINFLMMAHLSMQLANITWFKMLKAHQYGIVVGIITGLVTWTFVTFCRIHIASNVVIISITLLGVGLTLLTVIYFFHRFIISAELKELFDMLIAKRFKKSIAKENE